MTSSFIFVSNIQDGSVGAIMWAEAVLMWVQNRVFMPNVLNSPGYHMPAHIFLIISKREVGRILARSWLPCSLGRRMNVVMLPHQGREVIDVARCRWVPGFHLGGGKSRGTRTFASSKRVSAAFKFRKGKGGMHGLVELIDYQAREELSFAGFVVLIQFLIVAAAAESALPGARKGRPLASRSMLKFSGSLGVGKKSFLIRTPSLLAATRSDIAFRSWSLRLPWSCERMQEILRLMSIEVKSESVVPQGRCSRADAIVFVS